MVFLQQDLALVSIELIRLDLLGLSLNIHGPKYLKDDSLST